MKMDYDVIRHILLDIEAAPNGQRITETTLAYKKHSAEEIAFHLDLLVDAGLIETYPIENLSSPYTSHIVLRMTFKGHEYLNSVRSLKVWRETKSRINKVGCATLDIVKSVASDVIVKLIQSNTIDGQGRWIDRNF